MQPEMKSYIQTVTGYNLNVAESVILAFRNYIEKSLREGKEVGIENLGVFGFKDLPPRKMRNPRTGEPVDVPAKTKPTFKYSGNFVNAVSNGSQFFDIESDEVVDSDNIPFGKPESKPVIINDFTEIPPPPSNYRLWTVHIDDNVLQIPEANLKNAGLTVDSMVWDSNSNSWQKADSFSELAHLFN